MLAIISLSVGYGAVTGASFGSGSTNAFAAPVTGLSLPAAGSSIAAVDSSVVRGATITRTLRAESPATGQIAAERDNFFAASATPTAQTPVEQEDALLRAAAVAPTPVPSPYKVYVVQEGDTVASIAAREGVSAEYIIANNAEIGTGDYLALGQSLIIPAGDGILHDVKYGETLSDIAARYDVDVDAILSFAGNGIADPNSITEHATVFVPGAAIPVFEPAPEPVPNDPTEVIEEATPVPASDGSGDAGAPPQAPPSGPSSSAGLIWPFSGAISSYYSAGHPLGIDIDGFHNPQGAVVAATSGTVVFAGGNACCSYGLYVVIVSPDGIETLYAHLSAISVSQGQTVSQGEVIGVVGSTGYSTGVHLHFEVIDNGVRQNPLSYLP
ncbi:MAG TPA: M23 family metallopeptidase [Dehalococcoidia bacterium]|nr:M23 family metallopeptidase [Dehalococcoidia bacterium]